MWGGGQLFPHVFRILEVCTQELFNHYEDCTLMNIPGSIPVRRYLKKYVMHRENLSDGELLDLKRRGAIPLFLGSLLQGKTNKHYFEEDGYLPDDTYFEDLLHFRIDLWRSRQAIVVITWDAVRMFDSFLYHDFHDYLLTRILIERADYNEKEKVVIEQVMHELDIVDDISFDALKKSSFRLRKLRKIPHFRHRNCLAR